VQYENETQSHHVGVSPQADRGGTAGTVSEVEGWEEGGVSCSCCQRSFAPSAAQDTLGKSYRTESIETWRP
jgi:hypothetical protein